MAFGATTDGGMHLNISGMSDARDLHVPGSSVNGRGESLPCLLYPHICTSPFWAMICMAVDHGNHLLKKINIAVPPLAEVGAVIVGRMAFPMYLTLAAVAWGVMGGDGGRKARYVKRLLFIAMLSEYPYQCFFGHAGNVVFVILLAVIVRETWEHLPGMVPVQMVLIMLGLPSIFLVGVGVFLAVGRPVVQAAMVATVAGPWAMWGALHPIFPDAPRVVGRYRNLYRFFYPLHLIFFLTLQITYGRT